MEALKDLPGAERLTVTCTCDTFEELSQASDAAMASPGFVRYEVGPAGDL